MAKIKRTLLLKRVIQAPSDRYPAIPSLSLHTMMDGVFKASGSVWDRHYPRKDLVKQGRRCIFFERVNRDGGKAVLFHAYSYMSGHTPDQVVFDDLKAQISADPIKNAAGVQKEIVERFAVIVVGETMIIESARVSGSGPLAVHAMRDMIRRHVSSKHPNLKLEDAPSLTFKKMAQLHNGVESVTARLQSGFAAQPNTLGDALETVLANRGFENAKLATTIEAPPNETLDVDKVEALLDESETGLGLSGITVRFRSGAALTDLASYREKLPIEVQQVRTGVPAITEIETEIVQYLTHLATPNADNFHLIDANGMFT